MVLFAAEYLARNGHQVRLVVDREGGPLADLLPTNVELVTLHVRKSVLALHKLTPYLRAGWEDIIVSSLPANSVSVALAAKGLKARPRHVIWAHNNLTHGLVNFSGQLIRLFARRLYRSADAVVAVSDGVRNDLINTASVAPDDVVTIYNANTHSVSGTAAPDHPWLARARSWKVIISAGRLFHPKDFDTLIRAHALLSTDTRLLILGQGSDRPRLEALAETLGTAERVCFAGFVDDPIAWFQQADVFALSSRSEGFGNVLVEALSAGLPVVATDCESGPAEILQFGKFGSLVDVGDVRGMAAALDARLAGPNDRDLLRARALDFSPDVLMPRFEAVLRGVLDSGVATQARP